MKISIDVHNLSLLYSQNVIEIGSLDGKWSNQLSNSFQKVYCVDFTNLLKPLLKIKLKIKMGKFYNPKCNELIGFRSSSLDLIFSMDSLVRCLKIDIKKYLIEFYRVLRPNGSIYLHLPCNQMPRSVSKGFTSISRSEIFSIRKDIKFDLITLKHGIILTAFKSDSNI